MLLFEPILPVSAPPVFLPTLKAALRLSSEVLVAEARKLSGLRPTALGFEADEAPAAAYLNLRPYAPPKAVKAAGGYVVRPGAAEPDLLLIHRRGVWDLPKGKRDAPDTSIRACARREVMEELGIDRVEVVRGLGSTLHAYPEKGYCMVKTTRWFLMETDAEAFHPQAEEAIDAVAWVPWTEAGTRLQFDTLRAHHALVTPLVRGAYAR